MRAAVLLLSVAAGLHGADYHLELTAADTKINWSLGSVLHTVHGTFKLKRGDINFDPESGNAAGEVVIDAASGNSGNGARDSRMNKSVLESRKYPEASFAPARVEGRIDMAGTSNIKLHGIFTIHGASHPMTVPVQVTARDNQLIARLTFDVPYVEWGMKDPSTLFLKCNKSVEIEIQTTAHVSAPANSASAQ